jgi:hypothetical protein
MTITDMPWCRFALFNIKLTLAHLIWHFNLKLGSGTESWAVGQRIYNGWIQPALPVHMEKHEWFYERFIGRMLEMLWCMSI